MLKMFIPTLKELLKDTLPAFAGKTVTGYELSEWATARFVVNKKEAFDLLWTWRTEAGDLWELVYGDNMDWVELVNPFKYPEEYVELMVRYGVCGILISTPCIPEDLDETFVLTDELIVRILGCMYFLWGL